MKDQLSEKELKVIKFALSEYYLKLRIMSEYDSIEEYERYHNEEKELINKIERLNNQ